MWMIETFLSFLFPPSCLRCKKKGTPLCDHCIHLLRRSLSAPEAFIVSAFDFKDETVRRAIHAIKYHHRTDLISPLADVLAKELKRFAGSTATLVPIPMPKRRKLLRGYNQAELIASHLSKRLEIPFAVDILARSDNRTRQATIHDRATRMKNQIGSFKLLHPVSGTVILVDDVTTTGATLLEAKKTLEKNNPDMKVYAATLAH